jgi:hypothetical protein
MAAGKTKIFLTPIRPAILNVDPSGEQGAFYYNSSDQNFRFYDGSNWQQFGTGSGGGGGIPSGTILIIDGGYAGSNYTLVSNNSLASIDGGSVQ